MLEAAAVGHTGTMVQPVRVAQVVAVQAHLDRQELARGQHLLVHRGLLTQVVAVVAVRLTKIMAQ